MRKIETNSVEIEFDGLDENSEDWDGIDNHELEKFSDKLYKKANKLLGKELGKTNANPEVNARLSLYRCYKVTIEEGCIKAYFRKVTF